MSSEHCNSIERMSTVTALEVYSARAHQGPQEMERIFQPSMLPGTDVPDCCLVSFHFVWAILSTSTVGPKVTFPC